MSGYDFKEKDININCSKYKIAFKNLEEYDKGNYKPDLEETLKRLEELKNEKRD